METMIDKTAKPRQGVGTEGQAEIICFVTYRRKRILAQNRWTRKLSELFENE
tara:strand:+ start:78 stop:233 length:156 start_codon:yes stop_codon:yes gene_type:complete